MAKYLGKRAPARKATLNAASFFRADIEIPEHPPTTVPPGLHWPMDRNDQAGVCVVAAVDHTLQLLAANFGLPRKGWDDAKIIELYQTQNPDFHDWSQGGSDADGGMVIQIFLEELVRRGEIMAFAKIDHDNEALIKAGIFVGQSIVTGSVLREAHEDADPMDAAPHSPEWGGHAMCSVGYDPDAQLSVTWGATRKLTDGFVEHHMDEAWFILTPAMVNHPSFRNNFDLGGFADAVADLTNGKVRIPVPIVAPGPVVAPPGPNLPVTPGFANFPFDKLDAWARKVNKSDPKVEQAAKKAYRDWRKAHPESGPAKFQVLDRETGRIVAEIDDLGQGFFASASQ